MSVKTSSCVASHMRDIGTFQQVVSSSFVPLLVSSGRSEPFRAALSSANADCVEFTEVDAMPHLVERTPETIAAGGSGYYKMSLLLEGTSVIVQDGRELVMRTGDLTVYDTSRPYSLLFTESFRCLIMMFPKDRLELPSQFTEQLTAESLSAKSPLAPVISSFISHFPNQLSNLPQHVRAKLGQTSLGLAGTLFSQLLDIQPGARDPHQVMLQKIYDFIEKHLGDSELSPGMIAQAHYISTRHLHALFTEIDTTVSTLVRERRLERARAYLIDPAFADHTVAAIASRCGFVDAAHFSRVFKNEFGVSPGEYRRQ